MKNFAFSWQKTACKSEDSCLILTSSGGSGHLQAARAKRSELEKNHADTKVQVTDIMIDWLGPTTGNFFTRKWNRAQRKGNLVFLEIYFLMQWVVDFMICVPIFCIALRELSSKKINWVIDTQNMALGSIVKAIRVLKFFTGRKIFYEKVITDLPTKEATHFFKPIRKLPNKDRSLITLVTTKPLLDGESEEHFWMRNCKLSLSQIRYETLPLRPSFKKFSTLDRAASLKLDFTVTHTKELNLIKKAILPGTLQPTYRAEGFSLVIPKEHKVSVLMLGANPHGDALLAYIKHFIDIIKEKNYTSRKDDLFIFCNELKNENAFLMEQIISVIKKTTNYPSSLTIIPLSYQGDTVIAPLYYRSDATFTRSGGLTSMEILSACKGQVWIHKGILPKKLPKIFQQFKTIREGMPPWEKGNADYLMAKKDAKFMTTDSFVKTSASFFEE